MITEEDILKERCLGRNYTVREKNGRKQNGRKRNGRKKKEERDEMHKENNLIKHVWKEMAETRRNINIPLTIIEYVEGCKRISKTSCTFSTYNLEITLQNVVQFL